MQELLKELRKQKEICLVLYQGKHFLETHTDTELEELLNNLEFYWKQFKAVALFLANQSSANLQPRPRSSNSLSVNCVGGSSAKEGKKPPLSSKVSVAVETGKSGENVKKNSAKDHSQKEQEGSLYKYLKSVEKLRSQQLHQVQETRNKRSGLHNVTSVSHQEGQNTEQQVKSRSYKCKACVSDQKVSCDHYQESLRLNPLCVKLLKAYCLHRIKMESYKTRSPLAMRRMEGASPFKTPSTPFDKSTPLKEKLLSPCPDSPTEAKRRRMGRDDVSITSTVSGSQYSSRSHSPTFSESTLDDSYLSTPGVSPAGTLKDQFRKRYSKYELNIESDLMDQCLMDREILEACKVGVPI